MEVVLKEYGTFMISILGAVLAFFLITTLTFGWTSTSRVMIAEMTGVSYEQTQYIDDIEE